MEIYSYTRNTVYKKVEESREAASRGDTIYFPLPIGGGKQKKSGHRWNPADVRAHLENANPQRPIPESATARQKRHRAACELLKKKGVKVNDSNNDV